MAGKSQHYVWQMLLRGFAQEEYNGHHIWVYKKGETPERTVTRKFGVDKCFYGPPDSDADKSITDFENKMQGFIHDARRMPDGQLLDAVAAAQIISHLEARSRFIRDDFSRITEQITRAISNRMASPRLIIKLMSNIIGDASKLDTLMDRAGIPISQRPMFQELIKSNLAKELLSNKHDWATSANDFYNMVNPEIYGSAKSAQREILANSPFINEKSQMYASMEFSIARPAAASFIFPDTSLTFFTRGGCAPFIQKGDKLEAVILPLSTNVAIIGKQDRLFRRDMRTIRRAIASCAHEAFIAPQQDDELIQLAGLIGKNARLLGEAEIQSLLRAENLF